MTDKEFSALIRLIDDPDPLIYNIVKSKLVDMGESVISDLQTVRDAASEGSFKRARIEPVLNEILCQLLKKSFDDWKSSGGDLQTGALLVAKYAYPDLKTDIIEHSLEKIEKTAGYECRINLSPLEQIRTLNYVLYEKMKFKGNSEDFYAPENSFINKVLETGRGNSVTMAMVYCMIARRAGLPVYGVNLPKNFILAYVKDTFNSSIFESSGNDVMFYINPFNHGAVLGRREIDYFLKQQSINPDRQYYNPCSDFTFVQRLLYNLSVSYEYCGQNSKSEDIKTLSAVFDEPLPCNIDWD